MRLYFRGAVLFVIIVIISNTCCARRFDNEAAVALKTMTLEQKIGQMIMTACYGTEANKPAAELIQRYLPGGIIFFGYNFERGKNLKNFIEDLQRVSLESSGIPLFISVDQEGGRVRRIVDGVTQFPGNLAAGAGGDSDLVFRWARILGIELRMLGVNMNLAPVVDVNNNPDNPVINSRSFGSDPDIAADMGSAYIRGLQKSSCISVVKHFPGHGDTNRDSHLTLPVIRYDMERLRSVELYPFRKAIDSGVETVMTAHISYPLILGTDDSATISGYFLTDLLRKEMGFGGIVITDDMEMNAISKNMDMGEAAVRSVLAGADIVLISTYGENVPAIINGLMAAVKEGRLPLERVDDSVRRILEMKFRYRVALFNEGKITKGDVNFSDDDMRMLGEAAAVNEELSRRALYYHGDEAILQSVPRKGIIYTDNEQLRGLCARSGALSSVKGLGALKGDLDSGALADAVPCIHLEKTDRAGLEQVGAWFAGRKTSPLVICTGNPFPVAHSGLYRNMLFSFSNTAESLRQVALCLEGRVQPQRRLNCDLGIDGSK
ncbi:MAG TPA: glycoside hydrolase family 3 protein [Spirochaetota bacterium]|nr:glycoside hydrolase family 3 protein [Spirochaetota bacterium]HPI91024.1 glycoside hydrolase family 3 protein [Spirochaetota bacterium]HPR47656.1 glycoside hydrolase family 3 protein [Spirochaetota bacterium]